VGSPLLDETRATIIMCMTLYTASVKNGRRLKANSRGLLWRSKAATLSPRAGTKSVRSPSWSRRCWRDHSPAAPDVDAMPDDPGFASLGIRRPCQRPFLRV
jgi:hypothetical protein